MTYNPNLIIPPEVVQACQTLQVFAAKHDPSGTGQWQIGGLGPVFELQRQLDAVTAERDHLRRALELADALRNRAAKTAAAGPERREWRRE